MTTSPAPRSGTNRTIMWGVLGIIVGLLCCGVLGIIFGALSLRDAGRYGGDKILGYLAIAAGILNIVASGTLTATGNYPGLG